MLRIASIDAYPLVLPIREIYGGAAGFLEDCRSLIVRVEIKNGIEGWGEATQGRPGNTYETLETMAIMVRNYFAPALTGMNLDDTGTVLGKLHAARSGHPMAKAALETALYDALAKYYHLPLYRLLGGPYRKEIELVGGLGMDLAREAIAARARELKAAGFKTFKVKIGQKDHRQDVERVRAVREAVGAEAIVRVDGNTAYSFVDAHSVLRELACFKIADAEQPLARGDLKRLADLRKLTGISIAAQESIGSPEDALRVLQEDAVDLVKIKLTHIGGFQNGIQVAAIFGAKGLPVVVGQGSACTPILSAAEMHLHAALKNAQPGGEMTGFLRLGEQAVIGSIKVQNATALLNDEPGLGIEVNKQELMQIAHGF